MIWFAPGSSGKPHASAALAGLSRKASDLIRRRSRMPDDAGGYFLASLAAIPVT